MVSDGVRPAYDLAVAARASLPNAVNAPDLLLLDGQQRADL